MRFGKHALMTSVAFIAGLAAFDLSVYVQAVYAQAIYAQASCEPRIGHIASIQGKVLFKSKDGSKWLSANLSDTPCLGSRISTGTNSRAAIALNNDTVLRVDQNTTIIFNGVSEKKYFLISLLDGAVHFFSRRARSLKFTTPYVNGAVEGTEFLVRVERDQTLISLFEGRVMTDNPHGRLLLARGQSAVARSNQPPKLKEIAKPRDAVQWTLYYPPIILYNPEDIGIRLSEQQQSRIQGSVVAFNKGDLMEAFASIEDIGDDIVDDQFLVYRAGLSLTVGRVPEALADLQRALAINGKNSQALALRSMVAVVQNRKASAMTDAQQAVMVDPDSPAARIALSYAYQAEFDIPAAVDQARLAVNKAPDNAIAWARLAELRLSGSNLDGSLEAAKQAVALDPNVTRTQTVLGFANLTRINIEAAKEAFNKAIHLDSAAPLPRLGLGLTKIRQGHLKEGRAEIEIAAGLDPKNAILRSYLGKAYFDEKRRPLEARQFEVAKTLDPNDPTPWFYDAIRKQSQNRPVEALHDLQKSIALNDNRAVYRSRLLMDEDLAARSASLGSIYQDIGFEELALRQGWHSLRVDPANYSAHRLIADAYRSRPRYEVARVSELLQSQLLQPLSITPVPPQLAESNLLVPEGSGPTTTAFNEFNPLFTRNRVAARIDGVAGNDDTWGDEIALSGVYNRISAAVGQFHYETDGFRTNNDLEQDINGGLIQASLSPKINVQAEYRRRKIEHGDLTFAWDLDAPRENLRQKIESEILRAGLHFKPWVGSHLLASVMRRDNRIDVSEQIEPGRVYDERTESDGVSGELQFLHHHTRMDIIAGGGYYGIDNRLRVKNIDNDPGEDKHTNGYLYTYWRYPEHITWTLGASYDALDRENIEDTNRFNPKLGANLEISPDTRLRMAMLTGLKRALIGDQTIEPTNVAGFNQFFDDFQATEYVLYGIGGDHKFNQKLHGGIEFIHRELQVPILAQQIKEEDRVENNWQLYLYWTPANNLAVGAQYQHEVFEVDEQITNILPDKMVTAIIPVNVSYYHSTGVFSRLSATHVSQKIEAFWLDDGKEDDDFVLVDLTLGYRLPRRYGLFSVEIRNLFDQDFQFMDAADRSSQSILTPLFLPQRTLVIKLALSM